MTVKIKKLQIRGFRGLSDTEIDLLNEESFLVKGENGVGKSSIIDAIEFFFTGKIKLQSGVGITQNKHGPHIKFDKSDTEVKITFTGNKTYKRTFEKSPLDDIDNNSSEIRSYIENFEKTNFVLRRRELLDFISSTPAIRFKVISDFMGLEKITNIQKEFHETYKSFKRKFESKEHDIQQNYENISTIIESEIKSPDDLLNVLNKTFKDNNLPNLKSIDKIDTYTENFLNPIKKNSESIDKINNLKKIQEKINSFKYDNFMDSLKIYKQLVAESNFEILESDEKIINLLKESYEYIQNNENQDKCPVCEQNIDIKNLKYNLNKKIKSFEEKTKYISKLKDNIKSISNEKMNINLKIEDELSLFKEFEDLNIELNKNMDTIENSVNQLEINKLGVEIEISDFEEKIENIVSILTKINLECEKIISKEENSEEEKSILKILENVIKISDKFKSITSLTIEKDEIKENLRNAKIIYDLFMESKNTKVQELFDSLQNDIQKFYHTIHPNEEHKGIKLNLIEGRAGSVELRINSFGIGDEDPRALTSEGHLDSLGLCIFLALLKKFSNSSMIGLDDIVTTVDSAHRQRICKLLFTEFNNSQIFITTHDGIWYQQLKNSKGNYNFKLKSFTITDWDVNNGPKIRPYNFDYEKLNEKLLNGEISPSCAGNSARQYLEWILEETCKNILVPLPIKEKYMVNEMFDAAKKRWKEKTEGDVNEKIKDSFTQLSENTFMGNLLSHNNPEADDLSISEINNFINSVKNMHDVFTCEKCNKFFIYTQSKKIACPKCNFTYEFLSD